MAGKAKIIVLCTPSLGAVSLWWARQIAGLLWPLNIGKRHLFLRDSVGGEIAETRNRIVKMALELENDQVEVDSLFWVDDDVLITQGALLQLYTHHKPIVSGVYFTKSQIPEPLIFPARLHGTAPFVPDQVLEVWGHGMGLTLVKADVYRRMERELQLPKDKHGATEFYKTNREYKVEGQMLDCGGTEDLYFLDMAGRLGYRPAVDCGKWAFGFHYDLARHRGYPEPQFKQWAAAQPVTWQTDKGLVTWE